MAQRHIPVAEPVFDELELAYVTDAIKDRAISGFFGAYIGRFEREFAAYVGAAHGIAVANGTVAIHLALCALDIGPGDEVLAAAYTNMATFFPILQNGAIPVPIDVEPDTGNIDVTQIEARITPRTKAIIVVHVFGHPVDMDPVMAIARKHNLHVIEDAAEAHGALYKGRPVGSIGTLATYSFYANKIITTGEGGMVTTNDPALAKRCASLKSLAYGSTDRFMHQELGYNYRLPNLQAAIGCAQMTKIDRLIEAKRDLASRYGQRLAHLEKLQLPVQRDYARNVYWMYHVVLRNEGGKTRDEVMKDLQALGVETRAGFTPYNMQRCFIDRGLTSPDLCPVANNLARNAFYLPSTPGISDDDMDYVAECLTRVLA